MLRSTPFSAIVEKSMAPPVLLDRDAPIDGNVTPYEVEVIAALVKAHRPMVLFEIGTFDGRTSLNMAANAPAGAKVFTLDLPADSLSSTAFALELNEDIFVKKLRSGARFAGTDMANEIVQLLGDSATFDFSPYSDKVDFMFIDGSHAYEYVRSDTINALKMVRDGGVIIWHDYVARGFTPFPGVPRALKEFFLTDGRFAGLTQINDTSIVYLKLPARGSYSDFQPALLGDSTRAEYLKGALHITRKKTASGQGGTIAIHVAATNTGQAVWLPSDAPVGPVRLGTRVLSTGGETLDNSYWRSELPFRRAVFPGETAEFEAEIPWDGPGSRILEFDLVADGVAWFSVPERPRIHVDDGSFPLEVITQLTKANAELSARVAALSDELAAVRASTSWKITKPLRAAKGAIRRR